GKDRELEGVGDRFEGYTTTEVNGAHVIAIFDEAGQQVESVRAGDAACVALNRSPFYAEAGGQVSDSGTLSGAASVAVVDGLMKVPNWPRLHHIKVTRGTLTAGDIVSATVDADVR